MARHKADATESQKDNKSPVYTHPHDVTDAMRSTIVRSEDGDIVTGTVVKVDRDEVLVDIGFGAEGIVPASELSIDHHLDISEVVRLGEEIEGFVLGKDKEGRLILSKKRAQYEHAWAQIEKIKEAGGIVRGPVIEVLNGGLIVDIGFRGYVPAALVDLQRVRNLQPYIGQLVEAKIIELDRNRNTVVLSRRAWLEEAQGERPGRAFVVGTSMVRGGPDAGLMTSLRAAVREEPHLAEAFNQAIEGWQEAPLQAAHVSELLNAANLEVIAAWLAEVAEQEQASFPEILDALRPVLTTTLHTRRRALLSVEDMARAMIPSILDVDPIPRAAVDQARRRARLRAALLSQGAHTYRALAEGRGSNEAAVRQFVRRARRKNLLFTVFHDGKTLVPAFLLDEDLEPKRFYRGAIDVLTTAGEDSWALWAWFTTPSGWLDGQVPVQLAVSDAERVTEAARRRVSNAA